MRWAGAAFRVVLGLLAIVAPPSHADRITVFAAASLGDVLFQAAERWQAETGYEVRISVAGSSLIARQVEQGAPVDLVILANRAWMDWLAERDLIDPESRFDWLGNRLVVVGSQTQSPFESARIEDWRAALGDGRLAMALTRAVPAGIYGRQALEALGIWADLSPHIVEADNVRAALAWVATGAAPLGIVYATDARAEARVSVYAILQEGSHDPIRYPVAATDPSDPLTLDFISYLKGPEIRALAEAQGFHWVGE